MRPEAGYDHWAARPRGTLGPTLRDPSTLGSQCQLGAPAWAERDLAWAVPGRPGLPHCPPSLCCPPISLLTACRMSGYRASWAPEARQRDDPSTGLLPLERRTLPPGWHSSLRKVCRALAGGKGQGLDFLCGAGSCPSPRLRTGT